MGLGRGTGKGRGRGFCPTSQQLWAVIALLGFSVVCLHLSTTIFSSQSTLGNLGSRWSVGGWSSWQEQIRNLLHREDEKELKVRKSSKVVDAVGGNLDEEDLKLIDAVKAIHNFSVPSSHSDARGRRNHKHPRVAICLVGGARSFELTGLSIKKNVLDVYNNSDIFLRVPLDDDARKLTLLKGASKLAMAKVFENDFIPESAEAQEVLTGANSPNGIQGLLQYFRLVEGCLDMISSYEYKHKFKYDWIVRTRVDGYWSGPLPPLGTLNPRYYHVPFGSRFGGLNDRLGIGSRNTSWIALSRLSLIPKLHEFGYRYLNSEAAFKGQLVSSDVKVHFLDFPFCIVTARKYAWPLQKWGVPVASITSKGALNGAKCKPCNPVASGDDAIGAIRELDPNWGWMHPVDDLRLCDARHDPEPGWESMFDEVSGPELALVRQSITNRTEEECIKEVRQFGKLWEMWDAPTPETLCRRPPALVLDLGKR